LQLRLLQGAYTLRAAMAMRTGGEITGAALQAVTIKTLTATTKRIQH